MEIQALLHSVRKPHTHTFGRADTEDNMMNHNNNNTANSSIHKKTTTNAQ